MAIVGREDEPARPLPDRIVATTSSVPTSITESVLSCSFDTQAVGPACSAGRPQAPVPWRSGKQCASDPSPCRVAGGPADRQRRRRLGPTATKVAAPDPAASGDPDQSAAPQHTTVPVPTLAKDDSDDRRTG